MPACVHIMIECVLAIYAIYNIHVIRRFFFFIQRDITQGDTEYYLYIISVITQLLLLTKPLQEHITKRQFFPIIQQ